MTADIAALDATRRRLGLSIWELWLAYIGIGGHLDAPTLRAYLDGTMDLDDRDHDHITLALNEALAETGHDRPLAYRRT